MSKRTPKRVLAHVLDSPWAIMPESLERILTIAYRENGDLEAIAAELGRPLDNARDVTVRDGVATIPVDGPLFRKAGLFDAISGATSYTDLATDLTAAVADPKVQSILLVFDSPGGEVAGVNELAQLISQADAQKPVVAFVGGLAASAAYWLASSAREIVASETALLGSIGAVMTMRDERQKDAKAGVTTHEIVSSQSPAKHADPATTDGRARLQETVDAVAAVFIAAVAANRGVPEAKVISDFGNGHVLVGKDAVAAGLADRLGTYESVHAELAARPPRAGGPSNRAAATQETSMNCDKKHLADATLEEIAAAHPTLLTEARATAATAERERILGIQGHAAAGRETIIAEAVKDPACTAAMAAERILAADRASNEARLQALKDADGKIAATAAPKSDSAPSVSGYEAGRAIAAQFMKRLTPHRS